MELVVEGDGIDGIEIVLVVEIYIKAAHHHHKLLVHRRASPLRVDDERAVQSFGDVPGQGGSVAMVEMQAERLGIEFIGEGFLQG